MSIVEAVMTVNAGDMDDSQVEAGTGCRIGLSLGAPTSLSTPFLAISGGLHPTVHAIP